MSAVELYSYEACPYAQRSRMVLAEKAIDYQLHEIDLYHRPANWREISPTGKVPVLRHAGRTIYESAIINQYLDENFPEIPLMPGDPAGRAQARIWMDHCDHHFMPAINAVTWGRGGPEQRRANLEKAADALRELEQRGLADSGAGPYWFGEQVSLVDFQYLPFFERFPVYQELGGLEWPAACARLRAWLDAMLDRDSVRRTVKPPEFHIEQQRRLMERIAASRKSVA